MRRSTPPEVRSALAVAAASLALALQAYGVTINIGSATGRPGRTVSIQATVSTMGEQVGGVENDLAFDPETPLLAACRLSSRFANSLSTIGLRPDGCTIGVNCGIRAIVFTFPAQAIPDGALLYTCSLKIAAAAPAQTFPVTCSNPSAGTPPGAPLDAVCTNGQIQVVSSSSRTPTPTPTPIACIGSCQGGSVVTVDELLTMVNIALGNAPGTTCEAGDPNHDHQITIDEILSAVNNALNGCPGG